MYIDALPEVLQTLQLTKWLIGLILATCLLAGFKQARLMFFSGLVVLLGTAGYTFWAALQQDPLWGYKMFCVFFLGLPLFYFLAWRTTRHKAQHGIFWLRLGLPWGVGMLFVLFLASIILRGYELAHKGYPVNLMSFYGGAVYFTALAAVSFFLATRKAFYAKAGESLPGQGENHPGLLASFWLGLGLTLLFNNFFYIPVRYLPRAIVPYFVPAIALCTLCVFWHVSRSRRFLGLFWVALGLAMLGDSLIQQYLQVVIILFPSAIPGMEVILSANFLFPLISCCLFAAALLVMGSKPLFKGKLPVTPPQNKPHDNNTLD